MARRGENIRQRKDGRWEGRYIKGRTPDERAQYASVYADGYLAVKAKLAAVKGCGEKKKSSAAGRDMTLREALALFLDHHKQKLRRQTYDKYVRMVEVHLAEGLGRCAIARLDARTINAFLDEKQKHGRLVGQGPLSGGYIKIMRYLIMSALLHVSKQLHSPALEEEVVEYKGKKTECKVLSHEEQELLERYLCRDMDRTKLGVLLSLQLGLRIGEVCGLQWGDVNFQARTITIARSLQRIENPDKSAGAPKTVLATLEPKTDNSHRVIPLPTHLVPLLKRFYSSNPNSYVIADPDGQVEPRTLRNRFQRILSDCGLPQVNHHALRHSFATGCVENGMDIKTLSEILS